MRVDSQAAVEGRPTVRPQGNRAGATDDRGGVLYSAVMSPAGTIIIA
jgi:hypothetical protein